jgi:hypothetical protein
MSKTLLGQVCSAEQNDWGTFTTRGKRWFEGQSDYKSIWLSGDEKAPQTERTMTASPELALTAVRKPAGFRVFDVLSKGMKFCSASYLSHIMDALLAVLQPDEQHPFRKLVIHADNVCVHTSKMVYEYFESRRLRWAGHPAYSPDSAPSEVFLFWFIMGQLKGTHSLDGQALTCEVRRILSGLPHEMPRSPFDA